jgi:hypothetical protein
MEKEDKNIIMEENKKTEGTPIYLTPDSTLQSAEEKEHDASIDPGKDDTISVSQDDLRETDADRFAGSDRAGSSERKDNSID